MRINGQAYDSPGDGGDISVCFDFKAHKAYLTRQVAKYIEEYPDRDINFVSSENFLYMYAPSFYKKIEADMKREARYWGSSNYFVIWPDMITILTEIDYPVND